MRTLLAAVQRYAAFRAVAFEIRAVRQLRCATVTAGCDNALHQPWQSGASDVNRQTRAFRPIFRFPPIVPVGILVAVLPVLSIIIHKGPTTLLGAYSGGELASQRPFAKTIQEMARPTESK
jgi:hypothetical protein